MKERNFQITLMLASIIIGGIITFFLHFYSLPNKELSFEIISESTIIDSENKGLSDIQLLVSDSVLTNAKLFIVKLTNTGNQPILSSDFQEDLTISTLPNAPIYRTLLLESSPDSFKPISSLKNNNLTISPILINPTDSFVLGLISDIKADSITVFQRIIGIKKINLAKSVDRDLFKIVMNFTFAIIFSIIYLLINLTQKDSPDLNGYYVIYWIDIFITSLFLFFISFSVTINAAESLKIDSGWVYIVSVIFVFTTSYLITKKYKNWTYRPFEKLKEKPTNSP